MWHIVEMATITYEISLAVDCLPSIAGGIRWDGQSAGRTSVRRCSDLHSVFNSGLTVSRKCNESGKWMDVDFSACTMRQSLHRNVVVMQTVLPDDHIASVRNFQEKVRTLCNVLSSLGSDGLQC